MTGFRSRHSPQAGGHRAIYADNHGGYYSGEYRLGLQGTWNNPTGRGDALDLPLARHFDPDDNPARPGVVYLPPAYERREPCPLCRGGGHVKVSPLGEFPLAQGCPR